MKRKAEAFDYPVPAPPAQRVAQFKQEIRTLNGQFASWVASQQAGNVDKLWDNGVKDYVKYAGKLRDDYQDVLTSSGAASGTESEGGVVWVMGQGDMGQLGLGEEEIEKLRPAMVSFAGGLRALQVACGGMHTLVLLEGGIVYSWGVNDEGALGREARGGHVALMEGESQGNETMPEKVQLPANVRVKAVSAGDSHCAALTTSGQVYAWGVFRDSSGKFGFSPGVGVQKTPTRVNIGDGGFAIRQIASGSDHVLALTASGAIYTWGCAEFGRLGRLDASECDPKEKRSPQATEQWKAKLLTPMKISNFENATYIACGLYCSYAIAGKDVFACGVNNYGQLALDGDVPFYSLTRVPMLSGKGVVAIGGGEHHSLFLTSDGQVLSCGRATYGRLGRSRVDCGGDQKYHIPGVVEGINGKVVCVAAGLSVSGAVTENGSLYMWGSAGEGLLGKGVDEGDEHLPKKVPTDASFTGNVLNVSIGGQHMAILARAPEGAATKRQR